jgi:hypothetical protein
MKRVLGVLGTIAIALVFFVLVGLGFKSQTYASPSGVEVAKPMGTQVVGGKTLQHVSLELNVFPDASGTVNGKPVHPGGNPSWPTYGFTNQLQAPADAVVTMTIHQYDSGGALNNPYFAKVSGTIGGTETVDGKAVAVIDANNTGHTFTLRPLPGVSPGFFVNAPLPLSGNADGSNVCDTPGCPVHTIVFSFVTGGKGRYAWNCEFPCGLSVAGFGAVMGANGYMSGYLNVV